MHSKQVPTATDVLPPGTLGASHQVSVPRLMRPDEVATYLDVSERTLERWRICGEGPRYINLSRKVIRYTAQHLVEFLEQRVKDNTAQ
ncbi:helix-turn-helix domain-containing protein [Tistrella mobilis]|uniref:helix-turn-helix transcriptional regulator n=1 Tax=Tistrella mobilis TaxID=171437 RepID=UPI0031F69057